MLSEVLIGNSLIDTINRFFHKNKHTNMWNKDIYLPIYNILLHKTKNDLVRITVSSFIHQ